MAVIDFKIEDNVVRITSNLEDLVVKLAAYIIFADDKKAAEIRTVEAFKPTIDSVQTYLLIDAFDGCKITPMVMNSAMANANFIEKADEAFKSIDGERDTRINYEWFKYAVQQCMIDHNRQVWRINDELKRAFKGMTR